MLEVLNDTATKPLYHDELTWNNKLDLYLMLLEDEDLMESDSLITAFYDSCYTSNMGKLMRANNALQGWYFVSEMGWYENSTGTMEEYLDTLENITTSITPEDAFRDVLLIGFEKYLDTETITDSVSYRLNSVFEILFPDSTFEAMEVKDDAYSSSQLADLEDIAQRCPFEYGPGVYMARAMLSEMDTIPYQYRHECEFAGEGSGKWDENEEDETTVTTDDELNIMVFPNPATNELYVSITGGEKSVMQFEMWTTMGQRVKLENIKSGLNTISATELSSGIYHYRIKVDDVFKKSGKQIIVK